MDGKLTAYRKEDTAGKSQVELIIQVYDGALGAFRTARDRYQADDSSAGYDQLERARKFVTHLYTTLDHERGGDISEQLGRLYAFVINQINVAQATKDLGVIDDNITILSNLREGWNGLKAQTSEGVRTAEPTPAPAGGFSHTA